MAMSKSKQFQLALQVKSLVHQGLTLHQSGKFAEAQQCYEQVLALQPDHFDALQLLGALSVQIKQYDQAVILLSKALALNPHHAGCYSNRGSAFKALMLLENALSDYDLAILVKPDYAEAHFNRGNVLQDLQQYDAAMHSYDQAIHIKSNYAEAYYNRGNVLQSLKQFEQSISDYDLAIRFNPNYALAYLNRGNAYKALKRLEEALSSYDKAIHINPNNEVTFSNRGNVLKDLGRFTEALSSYDEAIRLKPDYHEAYSNRGNVFDKLQRFDEAISNHDIAIRMKPDYAEAFYNRSIVFEKIHCFDQALSSYYAAIRMNPKYEEAHWNLSLCLLLCGHFDEGFQRYEWRWKNASVRQVVGYRNFDEPLWLGAEALEDKTILLYAEQGLGDTIQFCRYVALVAQRGAKIILEVQRPLVRLLGQLHGVSEIVAKGDQLPSYDLQCPLLSLPLAFKTELHSIPPVAQNLCIAVEKMAFWSGKLGKKVKLRVGLVWSGSTIHINDMNRSLNLAQLLPYLPEHFEYICLQKEIRPIDTALLASRPDIKFYGDELHDFCDTAALCQLMDLVISVDTSVAHLSGTLNIPTWVLLPYCPDWRWLLDRNDSPWYPSVKLFRQGKSDWGKTLAHVKSELFELGS